MRGLSVPPTPAIPGLVIRKLIHMFEKSPNNPLEDAVRFRDLYFKRIWSFAHVVNGRTCLDERYEVMRPDGKTVAVFDFDRASRAEEGYWTIHTKVVPEHQRKGIGTTMYDFAEEIAAQAGIQLMPSPFLTPASHALWKKRAPDRLSIVKSTVLNP
jgi:GNAT superfamily N-acetyltransferase